MRDLLFKPGDIKSALAMVDAPQLLFVVPQFGFRKEPKHTYVHSTIVTYSYSNYLYLLWCVRLLRLLYYININNVRHHIKFSNPFFHSLMACESGSWYDKVR